MRLDNTIGSIVRVVFPTVAIVSFVACSGAPEPDSDTGENTDRRLPALAQVYAHCMERPDPPPVHEFSEWIGTAEGIVIGDVVDVQPAIDLTWAPNAPDGESPLYSGSECSTVSDAFSVRLENTAGYLHDEPLPDELTVHFGSNFISTLHEEQRPEIDEEGVVWPGDEIGIVEGMRIGGLVFYEPENTGRWSFRINRDSLRRFFEVENDQIDHQPAEYSELTIACLPRPPVDEIEELGETGLLEEVARLREDGELYVAPSERDQSVYRFSSYSEDPESLSSRAARDWVAACWGPPIPPGDECLRHSDCEGEDQCTAEGECVECVADAYCPSGTRCIEHECQSTG